MDIVALDYDGVNNQIEQNNLIVNHVEEANNVLQNGVIVETSKGLICVPLNDDNLSTYINISPEDLRKVAAHLIQQQNNLSDDQESIVNVGYVSESDDSSICNNGTTVSDITPTSLTNHTMFLSNDTQLTTNILCTDKSGEESSTSKSTEHYYSQPNQIPAAVKKKGRGGWPKGRKRKQPELLGNLPPKAPATSYNLYLNEQRKLFKGSPLPFYEITKIIGNRWSSLTLAEKKPYLEKAEEDKKRYREELKAYRQSNAYRAYLDKKRQKRIQNNISESDMDATDDLDEEDNEELYCRTCDQWFHNLHNKREHLQAKRHLTSLVGDIQRELSDIDNMAVPTSSSAVSTSLDESSLDGFNFKNENKQSGGRNNNHINNDKVLEAMNNLTTLIQKREIEIKRLKNRRNETLDQLKALSQQFLQLSERHTKLENDLAHLINHGKELEQKSSQLWQVPNKWLVDNEAI